MEKTDYMIRFNQHFVVVDGFYYFNGLYCSLALCVVCVLLTTYTVVVSLILDRLLLFYVYSGLLRDCRCKLAV